MRSFNSFWNQIIKQFRIRTKLRYPKKYVRGIFVYPNRERVSGLFDFDFSYINKNTINWCDKYQYYFPSQEIKYHNEIPHGKEIFEHFVGDNKNACKNV